jgi:serine/threonine-protein kinase
MASERDLAVAQLCLERGYATPEQVEECLKEASSASQTMRPVEAVLRHRGYISEAAYQELARKARGITPGRCPACGSSFEGEICPRCMAGFAQAPSGSRATPRPAAEPEVEKAAADPRNRFGKFVLLGEIGAGGMGVVYKAWQTDLRRIVALKFIRGIENERDLERFRREAHLAATLSHPGIAPIFESGQEDGKHYFAMQFVDGVTLDRLTVQTPRPSFRRMVEILARAAEAVAYAHEQGIIHRDLKPQNVMVDAKDRAYVMDFGLAKSVRTGSILTGSGFAVGTPAYMSPEQAASDPGRIDGRSDVYALGAILYQIGTGAPPFEGDNAVQILMDVVHRDPAPPRRLNPKFPTDLETIALKALEKDPARRYATASELAADLRRWLEGEPILARPASALTRLARKVGKHKLATAGVLALAAGLGVGSWALASRHREGERQRRAESARHEALLYYQEAAAAYEEADRMRLMAAARVGRYVELLEKAERTARHAVARDPAYADAHVLLGLAVVRQGISGRDGSEHFSRAIELEPNHLRAYLERGRSRLHQLFESYGLDTVGKRTGRAGVQLTFKPMTPRFDALRAAVLSDFEHAARLNPRPYERALLEGTAALASWRPGRDADLARAEGFLEQAANLAPNDPYPRLLLSRARLVRNDFAGAASQIAEAARLAPYDYEVLYVGALVHSYADRGRDALECVRRALEIHPDAPALYQKRGQVHADLGDEAAALADFEKALDLEPHVPQPYVGLAYLHFSRGRIAEALAVYERGLKHNPGDLTLLEGQAGALDRLGRAAEAEALLDRVVAGRPDADAYANRGTVRSRRGRSAEALRDFEEALRLSPQDPNALFSLGAHHHREKRYAEGMEILRRAIEGGADGRAHFVLGQCLFMLGKYQEAEARYAEALRKGQDEALHWMGRADALLRLERNEEAASHYRESLKRDPSEAGAHLGLGEALFNLGNFEKALPSLREAVRRGRTDAEAWMVLGEAAKSLKRWAEAEEAYTAVLERRKDDFLARIRRGWMRCEQGKLEAGLEDHLEALRLKPDDRGTLWEIALILYRQDKPEPALGHIESAIAAGKDDRDAHSLRGETLRKLERYAQAEEAFTRALALDPNHAPSFVARGRVRHALGKKQSGYDDLEAALRLAPDYAQAIGQRGILLVTDRRHAEGARDLRRAIALQPALKGVLDSYLRQAIREGKLNDE